MSHMSAGSVPHGPRSLHGPPARSLLEDALSNCRAAAAVTAVLIPIQIAVFIAYPYPKTVAGWYMLLQDKPLVGLVDLDLVLVVDNVLLVVIALAAYVALEHLSPSVMAIATGLWLLAIGMFIASNPAVQMLKLSHHFAAAPTDEQRSQAIAAGEAVLPTGRAQPSR